MSYIDNRVSIKLIDNLPSKNLLPPHIVPAFDVGIEEIVENLFLPNKAEILDTLKFANFHLK